MFWGIRKKYEFCNPRSIYHNTEFLLYSDRIKNLQTHLNYFEDAFNIRVTRNVSKIRDH